MVPLFPITVWEATARQGSIVGHNQQMIRCQRQLISSVVAAFGNGSPIDYVLNFAKKCVKCVRRESGTGMENCSQYLTYCPDEPLPNPTMMGCQCRIESPLYVKSPNSLDNLIPIDLSHGILQFIPSTHKRRRIVTPYFLRVTSPWYEPNERI